MTISRPILIIINRFAVGGAERLVADTVRELLRRGEEVHVITVRPEREATLIQDLQIPKSDRTYIPFRGPFDIPAYWKLVAEIRRTKPRVVVTHLWFANFVGRISAFVARVPTVISFEHNVYDGVKTRMQFLADRLLQRITTRVIAVSDSVRVSLEKHGIAADKISVVENGIDLDRFVPHAGERESKRAELGVGAEFLFLFAGRLVRQKGCDILLDAFARVPTGKLVIAGDGPDCVALEAQAKKLDITRRVQFLGSSRDMRALMASADCFVMPSRWEGLSIVLLEALAAGLPVIASDFNSARTVISDGVSGMIVPLENSDALAHAMTSVLSDTEFRGRLARAVVSEAGRFSIQKHVDTLLRYV